MDSPAQNRMEVLNICNINNSGELVLNDLKLLELIVAYPYLFNSHVRPSEDPDYEEWAWTRIAKSFNRLYENCANKSPYSPEVLKERWRVLKPLIKSLSKAYDVRSIPEQLRQIVMKISLALEHTMQPKSRELTSVQKMVLGEIEMVERLPLELRQQLETEVLDMIFNFEMNAKGTVQLGKAEQQRVNQECTDFLNGIGFTDVFGDIPDLENSLMDAVPQNEVITDEHIVTEKFQITYIGDDDNQPTSSGFAHMQPEIGTHSLKMADAPSSSTFIRSPKKFKNFFGSTSNPKNGPVITLPSSFNSISEEPGPSNMLPRVEELEPIDLLQPLPQKRFIPLHEAPLHVRECSVRLKRVNYEDYLPLSKIKIKSEREQF